MSLIERFSALHARAASGAALGAEDRTAYECLRDVVLRALREHQRGVAIPGDAGRGADGDRLEHLALADVLAELGPSGRARLERQLVDWDDGVPEALRRTG